MHFPAQNYLACYRNNKMLLKLCHFREIGVVFHCVLFTFLVDSYSKMAIFDSVGALIVIGSYNMQVFV